MPSATNTMSPSSSASSNASPSRYMHPSRQWDRPEYESAYQDGSTSPFASGSSNSPGRMSPNNIDLEESRLRSRRNEANSRGRLHEAEQRLRTAIYERGKQIPSSKHRVSQMAADLLLSDCQELASLNKRVSEVTAVNSQLTKDNYQLRKTVNDLTEQNRQLQESHHRLVSQHIQDKRQMQEELQQLRGTMWEANTLSSPSLTYNQWGQTAYDPQATGQYYRQ